MAKDETIGWEFLYILSDKIGCDRDIHDMDDVKFVTDDDQNVITKFKITVRIQDQSNARLKADQIAVRLTLLLVAPSGTYLEWIPVFRIGFCNIFCTLFVLIICLPPPADWPSPSVSQTRLVSRTL